MTEKATPIQPDVPEALKPDLDAARAQLSRLRGGAPLIGAEDDKALDATGRKDPPAGRDDHGAGDGATASPGPDAKRRVGQMDPTGDDYGHYTFSQYVPHNQSWEKVAEVIVTRPETIPHYGFAARMEYWKVSGNGRIMKTDEYTRMMVTKEGCSWPQEERALPFRSAEASFSCALQPRWSDWIVGERRANGADRLSEGSGFRADLSWDPTSRQWEGTLEWVRAPGASYVFGRVGRSGAELTSKGSDQTSGSLSCTFTPAWGLVTISGPT